MRGRPGQIRLGSANLADRGLIAPGPIGGQDLRAQALGGSQAQPIAQGEVRVGSTHEAGSGAVIGQHGFHDNPMVGQHGRRQQQPRPALGPERPRRQPRNWVDAFTRLLPNQTI